MKKDGFMACVMVINENQFNQILLKRWIWVHIPEGERFAFIRGVPRMLGPQAEFKQRGQSGAHVSDNLPHFAGIADEVSFLKAVHTDQFNHASAQLFVHSGSPRLGRPSMGSWVTYGLGLWMAGGGIKQGMSWGETDEIGYYPVSGKVSVHDVQATILNQLGFDHEKLTYQFQGRPFRLTDVSGKVISEIVA